jgi:polar amino acid transport system substrate-binding protein
MRSSLLTIGAAALLLTACGQATSSSTDTAAATAVPSGTSATSAVDPCAKANLTLVTGGKLTVGTDSPAYPPYFVTDDPTKQDGDPSSGQGFESAVTYAVADTLGFTKNEVEWVTVPFNSSYAPGDKNFDFDINQISITPDRQKAVDFSDGYYTVNQSVVALNGSSIANAKSLADLKGAKLGAQIGTTSLDFINNVIKPTEKPYVYNDTNDAKSALANGQIDGIIVDLPTAYYVTAAEIDNSKIVGQFKAQTGGEQFGLLFAKGNPLVTCINTALASLQSSGQLQKLQDQWLAGAAAPYFTE